MNEQEAKRLCALRELVRETFAQTLMIRTDTISDTADFFDELGGDSLDSLDVAVHLEEICGQRVPEEEYALCRCVEDAALLLLRLEQGGAPEAAPEEEKTVTPITRFEDTPEYAAFQQRLRTADETGNPYFLCNDSPLRDTSLHDGREILNFSSYNYAGMSGRPETVKAAQEAAAHYGCSASASRLLGGEKPIHKKLENAIAAWKHTEDAVVLVGGHSTNVTIVGNFCGKGDLIIYDALAHNSIHEGTRLSDAESRPFPHNDTAALETILRSCRDKYAKVLIVAEGVYSMDGDIAPGAGARAHQEGVRLFPYDRRGALRVRARQDRRRRGRILRSRRGRYRHENGHALQGSRYLRRIPCGQPRTHRVSALQSAGVRVLRGHFAPARRGDARSHPPLAGRSLHHGKPAPEHPLLP